MRCALEVPDGVRVCGACLLEPPPHDAARAAVDYVHPWDGLVARFKFQAALDLADVLAGRLLAAVEDDPAPDWLLPVPLSKERLRERGYNQAWELGRRVARILGCRTDPHLLLRLHDRPPQLALARERRAANVRHAFAIEPARRRELQRADVAVVDDVMTTGATAAEVSRVLLDAGAARVRWWVVARTPRPADA
ncbi:MAG: ComF family protein [Proteobacteria bacterium]|nr:ComF family protein [Pseudomonadota bacterium]